MPSHATFSDTRPSSSFGPVAESLSVLDAIDDPVVLVRADGGIVHLNHAARLRLSPLGPGERFFPSGSHEDERLRAYLALCAAASLPLSSVIDLHGGPEPLRFRCRGARAEGSAGGILLHLLPEGDARTGAAGEAADTAARREQAERDQVLIRLYRTNQEERRRLARDLHDQSGQCIAVLAVGIGSLEKHVTSPVGRAEIHRLRERLDDVSRELHRIAFELRPTALEDFGLAVAVRRLLTDWGLSHGIATEFETTGVACDLASEAEITLFRLCQEALTNVVKHAGRVTNVSVAIQYEGAAVSLIVEDDGVGCDETDLSTSRLVANGKFGIVGMRERVGLVAGTFEIESSPGTGTALIARIGEPKRRI